MSPNKKVTKEIGIGEALKVALPRATAALSYVPLPAVLGNLMHHIDQYYKLPILTMAAAPLSPPCRFYSSLPLQAKSRDTFCLNSSYSKMLGSSQLRAGEILKRGGFGVREHDTQRPLKPRSFGTFLGGTRKVRIAPYVQ
nr:hypothetical protein [Oscillospiraceae bacterium]